MKMFITYSRRSIAIVIVFLATLSAARADDLDDLVVKTMTDRKIPGVSVAVLKSGKVLRDKGYGFANLELRTPASDKTVYEIGSISKQFAAEAVMLLVEDGKLSVDDPITKYLPTNAPEIWNAITIRDLLSHTSGLKDWTEIKDFSYRREYSPEEFIDLVRSFPLQFKPRERWLYSNTNLPLIGIIVERASGKTFEDFVTERIIKPIAFPTIRFKHQEDIVPDRATGYVLRDGVLKNGEPFRPRVIAASGGILANAADLARWWEAVLKARVVKRASLDEMLTPVKLSNGNTVAHGFAFFTDTFNGHKMVQHFGSTVGGFGSIVRYYPAENITVAVIGNLEDGGFAAEYIAKRVADFYIPGAFPAGMKEERELVPGLTKLHLRTLMDIAENKTSETMFSSYAAKVGDAFRKQTATNLQHIVKFSFLGQEKITTDHFVMDPTLAEVYHYKMQLQNSTVYYHFRMDKDGKIGWIVVEE